MNAIQKKIIEKYGENYGPASSKKYTHDCKALFKYHKNFK